MEDCSSSISAFCTQLRSYCIQLEVSCATLRSAVDLRPSSLPPQDLPSLLTTLIDRVSSTSQVVGNLESKTTDTISFQELLGHCMEIYKQNEASIITLEDRLKEYGYTPAEDFANGDSGDPTSACNVSELSLEAPPSKHAISSGEGMITTLSEAKKSLSIFSQDSAQLMSSTYGESGKEGRQYGSLYSGSLSLQDLGISAAGLACLAQEDLSPGMDYNTHSKNFSTTKTTLQEASWNVHSIDTTVMADADGDENTEPNIPDLDMALFKPVSEDEFSSCPTWLKMQISFEDLNGIVDSMCDILAKKVNGTHKHLAGSGDYVLDQEDLSALSAGTKMKPCLLLLVRVGRLRTGHINGATVYHVVRQ